MCGINGFTWQDEKLIKGMNGLLKHRGPDDEGIFTDSQISLGHRRLSIIDLSAAGHQPMSDESRRYWIVYNGEIYNFREIRSELRDLGYRFFSDSDTEVVLKSYIQWGSEAVRKFNGMWAFAIYDAKEGKLFLSRDRFGIKPLYYTFKGDRLVFSSEIKPLLMILKDFRSDRASLCRFLLFGISDHGDSTFFSHIKQLPMGHNGEYHLKTGNWKLERYYSPGSTSIESDSPEETTLRLLTDSVRLRLIADVPVGSCLSGGLDSSTIVCIIKQLLDGDPDTFSLVAPGFPFDEERYQKIVEDRCRVRRHSITLSASSLLKDLPDLIHTQEQPFPTLSIYGQYLVMKLAREHGTKVLLDGQGSDEILGGYWWLHSFYLSELLKRKRPGEWLKNTLTYLKLKQRTVPIKSLIPLLLKRVPSSVYKPFTRYISSEFFNFCTREIDVIPKWRHSDLRSVSIYAIETHILPSLLRFEDRNSMRWSVESRVPFLDYRLVDFILNLPSRLKINNGVSKFILRKAVEGIVPEEITSRKDKIGFVTPDQAIIESEPGRELLKAILGESAFDNNELWNHRQIEKDTEAFLSGKAPPPSYIWKFIITQMWFSQFGVSL